MANDAKKAPEKKDQQQQAPKAVKETPSGCKVSDCKKSPTKFGFCAEHYEQYMAGVMRGDGKKPIDYETKLRQWQESQRRKVA
ncbi:MAG: hypothetical protein JST16_16340 [Bdellovibrionales bacterium]|nr:hypothetical protein [Bdellovibrionales bacterium]